MRNSQLLQTTLQRKMIVVLVAAVVLFFLGFFIGAQFEKGRLQKTLAAQNNQVTAPTAYAKQTLNKTYGFPIKDSAGKTVTTLTYTLQDAELMNQIILNGQPYNAVAGKTFLIVNLKLINSSDQGIQLPTRDYVRLSVNGSKDLLAADIHNDPVQIQAISTKYTRIGFPIDSNFKTLTLQVGQVDGAKDTIKLDRLKK